MSIPNDRFISGVHKYQEQVLAAFDLGDRRYFMLEWARRHRKTTLLINLLVRECCRWPKAKYAYVAPTQVWARNVVWDDPTMLKEAMPDKSEMYWETNEQKMMVTFANGSILKIGGSDKPDTFRGIDVIGVGFDEWALCKEELWLEIFRPIIAGPMPPHLPHNNHRWAMFLYTPKGINHASLMFDTACMVGEGGNLPDHGEAEQMRENWYASRIDAEQAGIMNAYDLGEAKQDMPTVLYDQELRCKRIADEERTLITSAMLNELWAVDWDSMWDMIPKNKKIVSIDPAFGGDKCIIRGMDNTKTIERRSIPPTKTQQIVVEAKQVAKIIGTKNMIIDCIGIGRGVADELDGDEAKYRVQYFCSSEKPDLPEEVEMYVNQRAAAYGYVSDRIRKLAVYPVKEKELLRQLPVASRYREATNNGKLLLIPKDQIRKELKCSPDDADSFVMGIYGLRYVRPEEKEPKSEGSYREKKSKRLSNPMVC